MGCREAANKQATNTVRRTSVAYLRRKSSAGLLQANNIQLKDSMFVKIKGITRDKFKSQKIVSSSMLTVSYYIILYCCYSICRTSLGGFPWDVLALLLHTSSHSSQRRMGTVFLTLFHPQQSYEGDQIPISQEGQILMTDISSLNYYTISHCSPLHQQILINTVLFLSNR